MAANLLNREVKNRVFLNVAGAEAVISHLEKLGIDTSGISNIHSIKRVIDKIDIADIILDNIHIDVRVIFDEDFIFVPKSHYKYGIVPDIYIVLKYDDNIERINLLGFFEPSVIDFNNSNDEYYFVKKDKLQSPFEMIDFISNFSGKKAKTLTQAEILRGRELSVMVADNDVTNDEFKEFLKLLLKSNVLRNSVLEYDNFETLASKAAFALQVKQPKKSDHEIVDFNEFINLYDSDSALDHAPNQSASDNKLFGDDNGDSLLDDGITEPIIEDFSIIEEASDGIELNNQILASEQAIKLAAATGEEIADAFTDGNELEKDFSDFVFEDNELAEPEVLNTEEIAKEDVISDFVPEDNELAEPEVLNTEEIAKEDGISDFVPEDNVNNYNSNIELSPEETSALEQNSFNSSNDSEHYSDISEHESDNVEDNNLTSMFELRNSDKENNFEYTVTDKEEEEELISINEVDKSAPDLEINNSDDDTSLVNFDNLISDNSKQNDSTKELDDNELLILTDKNNSQNNEINTEDIFSSIDNSNSKNDSNENVFDFSDIDNIENDNIKDNAEVSFDVIDNFDSFETVAPFEENIDVNFSEKDLIENDTFANSVQENSVIISNKSLKVGEIFIDINKDSSRNETFAENEHLEELYNNNEIQNDTGLNNDVRIISNKSQPIPIFVGLGGLALLAIILGIIAFSVSKFTNPAINENQNANIENKNSNNLGTDVPNTENINNGNIVMNNEMQRPGRQDLTRSSYPADIQQQEEIAAKPIPATAFLSVKKLSWEVPDYISYDPEFKQYLQSSGKGLKAALSSDLLLATDYTYSDQIRVSVQFDRAGNLRNAKILLSSGSSQVDNIVLQSVNQTLRALKAPTSLGNDEFTTLILKIYL